MDELWRLGVRELAAGIGTGSFSAREVLASIAARTEQVEGTVRAWATFAPGCAANEAAAVDAALGAGAGPPSPPGGLPLGGVPIGIKDVFLTRGLETAMGSPLFAGFVPGTDAAVVARLRAAGAVIPGKTATTAFAGADPAPTVNPWRSGRTPGGSSSGSAVAVACGMVPAALGTQTAGSVLRPAAFCGVVGFKPTFGVLSTDGVFPFARSLDTVGIMARSAADLACVFGVLAGEALADWAGGWPAGIRLRLLDVHELVSDPDISDHAAAVGRELERAGARVSQARLPADLGLIIAAQNLMVHAEGASVHLAQMRASRGQYGPGWQATTDLGQLIPAPAYGAARHVQRRLRREVDDWLGPDDLLILPACGDPVPDLSSTGNPELQALFTFLGLPAITLPTGFGPDGLPRGTQVVAARHADHHLLAVAAWLQQALEYPVTFPLVG
jgi:Asp-tRNA(Asn)/Glu-tRNA(Gln) amidotransferase A subunit family amidase